MKEREGNKNLVFVHECTAVHLPVNGGEASGPTHTQIHVPLALTSAGEDLFFGCSSVENAY